jgi:SAM-dependent methyltransferase
MIEPTDRLDTVKKAWNTYHADRAKGLEVSWWDSPVIVEECQRLVTGNPKMDIYEFLKKCLPTHPFGNGLSICSGSGEFERGLLDSHICKSIDAYEIAEERVREGIRLAKEKKYAISFHVEDVNEAFFGTNCYDIFFSWSALHHIKQLERVCENVRTSLKDNGVLVAQEYIGPNQFQWTDKQIQIINKILSLLPHHFKRSSRTGAVIDSVRRPTIQSMNESDPSEAIRSEDIIPTLQHYFKINAIRFFGGSIYHPLFSEIVGNFDHNDQKDVSLVKLVLLLERVLIEEGILDNHYAVITGEKR